MTPFEIVILKAGFKRPAPLASDSSRFRTGRGPLAGPQRQFPAVRFFSSRSAGYVRQRTYAAMFLQYALHLRAPPESRSGSHDRAAIAAMQLRDTHWLRADLGRRLTGEHDHNQHLSAA